MARKRAQFSAVSNQLNQIFFEFPFAVPEYFALITRAIIVLEGIALTGDKDFDLFSAITPHAAKHASRLFGAQQLSSMLTEGARAAGELRHEKEESQKRPQAQLTHRRTCNVTIPRKRPWHEWIGL